jgi:hypothetical protein
MGPLKLLIETNLIDYFYGLQSIDDFILTYISPFVIITEELEDEISNILISNYNEWKDSPWEEDFIIENVANKIEQITNNFEH